MDRWDEASAGGGAGSEIEAVESAGAVRLAPKAAPRKIVKKQSGKHIAYTFVRVRPLLAHLGETDGPMLPGLQTEGSGRGASDEPDGNAATGVSDALSLDGGRRAIGGFTGVFGMHEGNQMVFERAFRPCVPTVLRGGTASLFCYGYTSAGKTHTVFGVDSDRGMYHRAAEELLRLVAAQNASVGMASEGGALMLHASVLEVYNDSVFDLLAGRAVCALRTNGAGQLCVRGKTSKRELDATSAEAAMAEFAVVTEGLTTVEVASEADLTEIYRISKAHRAVGSSSVHDQSSRSHAVFRIDVVTAPLLALRAELDEAESLKPGVQSAFAQKPTLAHRNRLKEVEGVIERCTKAIDALVNDPASAVGGTMLLVDLAGADSDSRDVGTQEGGTTLEERQESQAINKSLLALKEVLRGLNAAHVAGKPAGKLPFRDSSITRILEETLMPRARRDAESVMLVNVAPPAHLEKKTVNSLRYGQLYAAVAGSAPSKPGSARKPWAPPPPREGCEPDLAAQGVLRELYRVNAPEKTAEDVERILRSFCGREAELLEKVNAKYGVAAPPPATPPPAAVPPPEV